MRYKNKSIIKIRKLIAKHFITAKLEELEQMNISTKVESLLAAKIMADFNSAM